MGKVFRRLAQQKESGIEEGHLRPDHVHMMISIPPKYSVAQVVGSQREECDPLARNFGERRRNFAGQHFWARGYFVSTVGRDEATIREYIRNRSTKTTGSSSESVALSSHLKVAPVWTAQRHVTCRFERLTI